MDEIVTARNTEDGSVGLYRRSVVEHPVLGKFLEVVPANTKPRVSLEKLVRKKAPKVKLDETPETVDLEEKDD